MQRKEEITTQHSPERQVLQTKKSQLKLIKQYVMISMHGRSKSLIDSHLLDPYTSHVYHLSLSMALVVVQISHRINYLSKIWGFFEKDLATTK